MKNLAVVVVVLLLFISVLEIKGDNRFSTLTPMNLSNVSTKDVKSDSVVRDEEIVLRKWRTIEKILQGTSSRAVKSIFPFIVDISQKVNVSSQCSTSILKIIYGIKQMKTWAFRMIDASGKIPNGIWSGSITSVGDFDGCLSLEVPGSTPFRGQYCSVIINLPLPKIKSFHKSTERLPAFVNFTKEGTVIDEAAQFLQYFTLSRPRTSICVPSTCSRAEIVSIVDALIDFMGLPLNISVPTCDVIEPVVLSKGEMAIICLLSVFALLTLVGTIMDVYLNMFHKEERQKLEENSSNTVKCLMCFSAYTNTQRLLKPDTSLDSIKVFHGMKVVTVLWVALTHVYGYMPFSILGGTKNIIEFRKQYTFQVIANAYFDVDTFFFMSAALLAYARVKFMGNRINIPMVIFHRLWRLTPPFMLVIAAFMLLPHMGSGPIWKEVMVNQVDKCKENWWTNLLYINNFLPDDKMCFEWFWYIPVDTHLYILALFVIAPLKSRPKLALGINGLLFLAGTIVTAATHVYYKHQPTALLVFSDRRDMNYILENEYFRSYVHIPVYSIGIFAGYVLATVPKMKIPKIINICGWIISMALGLLVVYGSYDWNQGNLPGLAVSTLYACTSKVLWALALSYVTIACSTGNGGIITSMLGWSALVPLARLTFCFYMVHPIVHYMYTGSSRTLTFTDHKSLTYVFLGTIVISYMVAYVVSLMFESPFMCLNKIMFSRVKSSKAPELKLKTDVKQFNETEISAISIKKMENELA